MIRYILTNRFFLMLLFIVNVLGTIYGYWWYRGQLAVTPDHFLIFVPDSPTASLFFCVFLAFFIMRRNVPYVEALAVVTLFKYGIWAVVMNVLLLLVNGSLSPTGFMLIASHGAMAIQGLLYTPYYKIKMRHLVFAGIWTLHNDIIDYVFEMMPVYGSLMTYMNEIGYFTFWLSIVSIAIAYFFTVHKSLHKTYNL
ncbi:lipoprotein heptaprenylglyceryl N-acetyltransferase LhaT [Pontibacillus marinus]|uniref:Membrane protein n=1 Tax=Pontibacillus marinus BH030004 = DSM 16465 TaxID=1385511 RepID=A0A0A5FZ19_9BACI|nr:DUF1405 domain-containing protein [Pontibacillus marinus]KGX84083.1 membrane protein [Pontibacillus marinus BH030004 = DSM 16465]